jgi:hypothetical protein
MYVELSLPEKLRVAQLVKKMFLHCTKPRQRFVIEFGKKQPRVKALRNISKRAGLVRSCWSLS